MKQSVYKIRRKDTGEFKVKRADWKIWNEHGDVYATIAIARGVRSNIIGRHPKLADVLEIVEYELTEVDIH